MAFDCFFKIDGVPGESTDDKHKDWIEITAYNHGVSQLASGSASSGGGRSAERCDFQDFSITKTLDKASPKLALFCCNGTHIGKISMELCRATGDKQKYMEYVMSDVIVSSVSTSGASIEWAPDREPPAFHSLAIRTMASWTVFRSARRNLRILESRLNWLPK